MRVADDDIKRDVEDEIRWDPDLDPTDIAVAVKDGVVELTGFVRSYNEKLMAEDAAKRVVGVLGVANDIEVRLPEVDQRPDPEIARDAVMALRAWLPFASENIRVSVKDGWVTLEGEVKWNYQRWLAQFAVRRLRGVKGVTSLIQLKPRAQPEDIQRRIEEALQRSAAVDAANVQVEADGSEVVLKGAVRSWVERAEAERAAWAAPGVTKVDNELKILPV